MNYLHPIQKANAKTEPPVSDMCPKDPTNLFPLPHMQTSLAENQAPRLQQTDTILSRLLYH